MGTVVGRLLRPLKNYNVENRAHKVISQEKPKVAPTFKSTQKLIDLVNELEPNYKDNAKQKNVQLDNHLKSIYVTSNEIHESNSLSDPNKPLPKIRLTPSEFEYGFYEPEEVQAGKITLRQAVEFIENHNKEPQKYTINFIADKYKLDPKVVDNILEYHKIFRVKNLETEKVTAFTYMPISIKSGTRIPFSNTNKDVKKKVTEENTKEDDVKQIERS